MQIAFLSWVVPIAVAALLLVLHRRQEAPVEAAVSSMLVWRQVIPSGHLQRMRPRRMVSLLLVLGIGACLASAIVRAFVPGATYEVIVLDNAFSMSALTSQGASRWQLALRGARHIVSRSPLDAHFMVLDTMTQRPAGAFVSRAEALAQIDALAIAPPAPRRMPAIPSSHRGPVHLLTDGAGLPELRLPTQMRLQLHPVFEAAPNAALSAFDIASMPTDPTRHEALVRLVNDSPRPAEVAYTVEGEQVAVRRVARLDAGEALTETFVLRARPGERLRADVFLQGDAVAADDTAHATVPRGGRMRVLLVSPDGDMLASALRLLPEVELRTLPPDRYRDGGDVDVYVFQRFAPATMPSAGVLQIGASAPCAGSGRLQAVQRPRALRWVARDALAAAIDWGEVRVDRAHLHRDPVPGDGSAVVVDGVTQRALIWRCEGRRRTVALGFDLADSNLAIQPGFPVLLAQAMHWLASADVSERQTTAMFPYAVNASTLAPAATAPAAQARGPGERFTQGPALLLAVALALLLAWWAGRSAGLLR